MQLVIILVWSIFINRKVHETHFEENVAEIPTLAIFGVPSHPVVARV